MVAKDSVTNGYEHTKLAPGYNLHDYDRHFYRRCGTIAHLTIRPTSNRCNVSVLVHKKDYRDRANSYEASPEDNQMRL